MKLASTLLLLSISSYSQPEIKKTPVYIECACQDRAGSLFAKSLRAEIASSPQYEASPAISEGRWGISIVSTETGDQKGQATAMSVVIMLGDSYLFTHWTQLCMAQNVKSCADETLASFDKILHGRNVP